VCYGGERGREGGMCTKKYRKTRGVIRWWCGEGRSVEVGGPLEDLALHALPFGPLVHLLEVLEHIQETPGGGDEDEGEPGVGCHVAGNPRGAVPQHDEAVARPEADHPWPEVAAEPEEPSEDLQQPRDPRGRQ